MSTLHRSDKRLAEYVDTVRTRGRRTLCLYLNEAKVDETVFLCYELTIDSDQSDDEAGDRKLTRTTLRMEIIVVKAPVLTLYVRTVSAQFPGGWFPLED